MGQAAKQEPVFSDDVKHMSEAELLEELKRLKRIREDIKRKASWTYY